MTIKTIKFPAAACPVCGGWTRFGGMSQHSKGPDGCKCHTKEAK
jgi:hypothetical protein